MLERFEIKNGKLTQSNRFPYNPMTATEFAAIAVALSTEPQNTKKKTTAEQALFVICPNGADFFTFRGDQPNGQDRTSLFLNEEAVLFFQPEQGYSWVMRLKDAQEAGWQGLENTQNSELAMAVNN